MATVLGSEDPVGETRAPQWGGAYGVLPAGSTSPLTSHVTTGPAPRLSPAAVPPHLRIGSKNPHPARLCGIPDGAWMTSPPARRYQMPHKWQTLSSIRQINCSHGLGSATSWGLGCPRLPAHTQVIFSSPLEPFQGQASSAGDAEFQTSPQLLTGHCGTCSRAHRNCSLESNSR